MSGQAGNCKDEEDEDSFEEDGADGWIGAEREERWRTESIIGEVRNQHLRRMATPHHPLIVIRFFIIIIMKIKVIVTCPGQ